MRVIARGVAGFLGGFALSNVIGEALRPGFDANAWLLSPSSGAIALAPTAVAMLAWAAWPRAIVGRRWMRILSTGAVGWLALLALADAVEVLAVIGRGQVDSAFQVPLSLLIAVGLGLVARTIFTHPVTPRIGQLRGARELTAVAALAGVLGLAFPLAQFLCFGKSDYRRPADAAVVFGARTYADGRPSTALFDRVATAVELYHEGLAPKLVMSGGPGDGATHEVEAMRDLAIQLGVPEEAIELDYDGWSTADTVANTGDERRLLAVSHWFHLPRIKMAYQREGCEVFTVPAKEAYILSQTPYLVARETAAFWVYWLRGQA